MQIVRFDENLKMWIAIVRKRDILWLDARNIL